MASKIIKRAGIREQRLGEELMVFDDEADLVHVLNATSAVIWECLDQSSEEAFIEQRLRDRLAIPPDREVASMIAKALEQFREKNLVADEGKGPEVGSDHGE